MNGAAEVQLRWLHRHRQNVHLERGCLGWWLLFDRGEQPCSSWGITVTEAIAVAFREEQRLERAG